MKSRGILLSFSSLVSLITAKSLTFMSSDTTLWERLAIEVPTILICWLSLRSPRLPRRLVDLLPKQVVLGWAVQSGSSVIPKSLTPSRITANFDVQSSFLSIEQMNTLKEVDQGHRFIPVPYYSFPPQTMIVLSLIQPKQLGNKGLSKLVKTLLHVLGDSIEENLESKLAWLKARSK